ncbi:NAD(P)/FAD-dependent oxidoreductase [Sphingomonas parva]|uniref:NAD(P)/FAD-dependent oxidoreductase n=1 Tax=Sphingomonas parva TaxID=2555898 RepID=A0A4Y8ZWZ9_9SPHN|nr:NAD(P)/FAD-dependent oxidoreductase [Sphingomonas parva]TFI59289.1 NAD(P)/FAD-dependent oxidoreductase [Sphingomonas parva]
MDTVDVVVAGAGVIGIAIARALALAGREVLVLEAGEAIGSETSSRNSEVIHAGLYYPAGSLMARTCVAGREALYAYAAARGVLHRRIGKLIVATEDAELATLHAIRSRAAANGVDDLVLLSREETLRLEPALRCEGALLSPSSGIVDSHALMLALQGDAENAGALFVLRSPVEGARATGAGIEIRVGGDAPLALRARLLVNAAGLHAPALAARIDGLRPGSVPTAYYAKGHYMTLSGRVPFARLIYPVPVPGGLGVHLTLDIAGQARFGPDVEWVDRIDYRTDDSRRPAFEAAIRRYWPDLPSGVLEPAYAGIRPKIVPPGAPAQDFLVQGPTETGTPAVINLFGIESPGLTASLAIANDVERLARTSR